METTKVQTSIPAETLKQAKFWDKLADGYSKQPISDQAAYDKKLALTRQYMTPSSKVFEFGCGTGSTAILHAPHVKSIHGVDVSSNMISIAKEKALNVSNVKFEAKSIDQVSVPDNSMDVVMGMSILHLLPNRDEVIQRAYKMLKPGGVLVTNTECMGELHSFMKPVLNGVSKCGLIPKLNIFSIKDLRKAMKVAGFEIVKEYIPYQDDGKKSKSGKCTVFLIAKKSYDSWEV